MTISLMKSSNHSVASLMVAQRLSTSQRVPRAAARSAIPRPSKNPFVNTAPPAMSNQVYLPKLIQSGTILITSFEIDPLGCSKGEDCPCSISIKCYEEARKKKMKRLRCFFIYRMRIKMWQFQKSLKAQNFPL